MKLLLASSALAIALAGCTAPRSIMDNPNFSSAVGSVVNGTNQAAKKANDALDTVCQNYALADFAFQSAVTIAAVAGKPVPQKYIDAETQAVALIADVCTNRPADARTVLTAVQKALATVVTIRDRFRA